MNLYFEESKGNRETKDAVYLNMSWFKKRPNCLGSS